MKYKSLSQGMCSIFNFLCALCGCIIRKWTYYAIAVFTALIVFAILNAATVISYIPAVFNFLTGETSFLFFMLKAAGLWIVITGLSLLINRYTPYHKSRNISNKRAMLVCVIAGLVIAVIIPAALIILGLARDDTLTWQVVKDAGDGIDEFEPKNTQIEIDISHLQEGSDIKLVTKGIRSYYDNHDADGNVTIGSSSGGGKGKEAYLWGEDTLAEITGNT